MNWHPTHTIINNDIGQKIRVMLDDGLTFYPDSGPLYTEHEWEHLDTADYELVGGTVLFQGKAFNGEINLV